jgi:hypothetical protein
MTGIWGFFRCTGCGSRGYNRQALEIGSGGGLYRSEPQLFCSRCGGRAFESAIPTREEVDAKWGAGTYDKEVRDAEAARQRARQRDEQLRAARNARNRELRRLSRDPEFARRARNLTDLRMSEKEVAHSLGVPASVIRKALQNRSGT